MAINQDRLLDTFFTLVRIDNPSGGEAAMAAHLIERCQALGLSCEQDAIGNVIARLAGAGAPLLLNAHMDSVAPCHGKEPVLRDGNIYSAGDTVLGADDLAGVTAFLEGVQAVIESGKQHRAIELVFTVQEETGLNGARALDYSKLQAKQGLAFDLNGDVGAICIGSPAHDSFTATITGVSAHAGVAPEKGISAIEVASHAIAAMPLGRLDDETTANIGSIQGGKANNIVPDVVVVKGEARSRNQAKLDAQWQTMRNALEQAAAKFGATVEIEHKQHYGPSVLAPDAAIVQLLNQAIRAIGLEPSLVVTGGGSDVSIISNNGIETANLAIGYENIHSVDEFIPVVQLQRAAQIVEQMLLMI
ncbi:M20/M25/M40 family metallo-hydrolase [Herpetosiphon giganteus]|uniref:M20/M25/M40 family metallo-hydrolase n=1 Tax=Herpetosiphon giganteus TaxID=2029754 RepID=UPI00195DBE4C|nr:M20/M25/M40 family metallo-hydrolase [Herpetosiphon giganteus]MBM7846691.1 tripeptide aminopeptidase [Herpetosiphon giganteus]